ncbi:hypothetical protein ACJX0J_028859 [Zea mays]
MSLDLIALTAMQMYTILVFQLIWIFSAENQSFIKLLKHFSLIHPLACHIHIQIVVDVSSSAVAMSTIWISVWKHPLDMILKMKDIKTSLVFIHFGYLFISI